MKDKISTIVFTLISLFECTTVILGLPGLLGDILFKCGVIFLGVCGSWLFWLVRNKVTFSHSSVPIRWLPLSLMWLFIILTAGTIFVGLTGFLGHNWMVASGLQILLLMILWLVAIRKAVGK